jgi:hypothetical protein
MKTKDAARLLVLLLVTAAVPGCATISVLGYRQDPASGVSKQTTTVHLIGRSGTTGGGGRTQVQPLDRAEIDALGADFATDLAECGVTVPPPPPPGGLPLPLLLPLVGFAVQQGVDYATGLVAERAKVIQDASTATYDARVIVGDPALFAASECLLVLRRGPPTAAETTGNDINMLALLRMEHIGVPQGPDAFEIRPLFVQIDNAVAWTAAGKPVSMALAVAGKGARTDREKANEVKLFAQSTMKIPGLAFGTPVRGGASSGLVPLPPDDVTAIEFTVGVTEVGAGAPDAERAKSEMTALAKAVGPALAEQAKTLFQPREAGV